MNDRYPGTNTPMPNPGFGHAEFSDSALGMVCLLMGRFAIPVLTLADPAMWR